MCHNENENVPAARMVAERPSSVTWHCGQIVMPGGNASPEIGPQVASFHFSPSYDLNKTDGIYCEVN